MPPHARGLLKNNFTFYTPMHPAGLLNLIKIKPSTNPLAKKGIDSVYTTVIFFWFKFTTLNIY